ncbi:hypothetical protein PQX77_002073 [Marasmius sp. AFHP31]|nr:hypothetical protein PQX77_002073 [Marasmius sp. AFHP31]
MEEVNPLSYCAILVDDPSITALIENCNRWDIRVCGSNVVTYFTRAIREAPVDLESMLDNWFLRRVDSCFARQRLPNGYNSTVTFEPDKECKAVDKKEAQLKHKREGRTVMSAPATLPGRIVSKLNGGAGDKPDFRTEQVSRTLKNNMTKDV